MTIKYKIAEFILSALFCLTPGLCVWAQQAPLTTSDFSHTQTKESSVAQTTAPPEINRFKNVLISSGQADTATAVRHLFHRKRNGGSARAVVFGLLALTAIINTANYTPTTVTVNPGTPNAQTLTVDDSPPTGNYLGIGLFTLISITGISQHSYFSNTRLTSILADLENGKPLPAKVKKMLKKKDFKVVN